MSLATMTSKGQITIPKNIREGLGLQPKDQIQFTLTADCTVIMRAKKRDLKEMYGLLHDPGRKPITVDEMRQRR